MLIAPMFDGVIDLIGDVHGELAILKALLGHLGYRDDGSHPDRRRLVFLGDLCDRGPDSPGVIELVRSYVQRGRAQCVLGNHELNLLRRDAKHGNRWYLEPDHAEQRAEFAHCRPAPRGHDYHAFFASLPLALERDDLRAVHAAWHAPAIEVARATELDALALFDREETASSADLETRGVVASAAQEKAAYGAKLTDKHATVPLLRNLGLLDQQWQMGNAVRVLTSGVERLARAPFYANGKWRMVDRVDWWDEYSEAPPVIVGHYWRAADTRAPEPESVSGGKPDLFAPAAPHEWVGRAKRVYCVDFSIGGRYVERARGASAYRTRLAAVRWPEQQVMFDDGEHHALV
jgi:hypothetical protein